MKNVTVTLKSMSPYSQSQYYETEKLDKETHKDYEARTWRDRMHADREGNVFIPPMSFKNCIAECAKYLSIQIPGKGKATYTKHFEAGVAISPEPIYLGIKKDDVDGEWLMVPSDGVRGGTKRVPKCFPVIHEWQVNVTFMILDYTVTEEVFEEHLDQAGKFIGIGRFRPRRNGFYGRFEVLNCKWEV